MSLVSNLGPVDPLTRFPRGDAPERNMEHNSPMQLPKFRRPLTVSCWILILLHNAGETSRFHQLRPRRLACRVNECKHLLAPVDMNFRIARHPPGPDILNLLDLSCPTKPLTKASNGIR